MIYIYAATLTQYSDTFGMIVDEGINTFPGNVTTESEVGTHRFHLPMNFGAGKINAIVQGQDRGYTFYARHEPDSNTVTVVCFNNNAGEPTDGGLLHVQLRIEAYV